MNINKVVLAGRLTRDCETRFTQAGLAIVKFGVAVNEKFKSGDEWKEKVTFVDVTLFGKRGEAFAKFFHKGSECYLEGKLNFEQWDDKQTGEKKSKLAVIADEWQFVGGKQDGERKADAPQPSGGGTSDGVRFDDGDAPF